ncbi:hypothetical protein Godav_003881 [Gossypium davidsonii]|nr:hypothetical protein [Gossypium davidsonii]
MSANEARKVLSIPLSRHLQEGKQAWRAEAFGKYSVRSGGYKLLLKESAEVEPNLQRATSRQVYKKLWLIELPEKIKITFWRAYKKFIPIYKNLQKIRLRNTVACPRCTYDDESLEHASRDCQGDFEDVKYLLAYVNVVRKLQTVDGLRFMQNNYLCHLGFWGDRNKQVHERKIRHNIKTVRFITMYLKGLEEIKGRLSARCVQKARWRPLEGSFVKINFYASFQGQLLKSGSGLVGRDSAGQIVGMRMILNDYVPSPFAGEAIACLQGVQMGLDPGFHGVILEGDSLTVVKKLQNKNKDISEINPIIEDVKRAGRGFVECRFNFVGRNTNGTAHRLAKEGLVNGETSYLMERTPKAVWKAAEEDSRWAELGHLHRFGFLGRDP